MTTLAYNSNSNNYLTGIMEEKNLWNNKVPSKVIIDSSNSDFNLDFNFDYDKSIEWIHNKFICKEIVRLKVLEVIKSQPNINFIFDNEKINGKFEDINIFNDINFGLDEKIIDNKSIDLIHSIRSPLELSTQIEK
ncbi:hypothetical protein RhiirA4_481811 [Rhizophagus irregularis]|uniref:Uncharacterized protein n=1 Tax=Rhizophagus irregularis TaxID=588596 RepID=A0A2I1HK51_9GLOM|nr:hypothetical protein RhiirA4_481811 [Rhizophagus irregularis]